MSTIYDHGEPAYLTITLTRPDENGVEQPYTPDTIALVAIDPTGDTVTTDDPAASSDGVYEVTLPLTAVGQWAYHWVVDGAAVEDGTLTVTPLSTSATPAALAARARIARLTDATTTPVLDDADLDELVLIAASTDTDDLPPTDEDWTPTYDGVYAAVAEGWSIKAGRVAAYYDFGEDGQTFNRSQVYAHCVAQEKLYRRKAGGTSTFRAMTLESPYSGTVGSSIADSDVV